jgi:hypothetical protein
MADIDLLFTELQKHINELEQEFIQPFLPANPAIGPDQYALKVRAYCILSHAAFEEFFETIALEVMDRSITEWLNTRKITDSLLTLVSCYGLKIDIEDDKLQKVFDHLYRLLEEAKRTFSREIHDNHGISQKYLRKLLIPVGLDLKQDDPVLLNSLVQLSNERGPYAHKGTVNRVLAPEDAKKYVVDCLELCSDIRLKAVKKFA